MRFEHRHDDESEQRQHQGGFRDEDATRHARATQLGIVEPLMNAEKQIDRHQRRRRERSAQRIGPRAGQTTQSRRDEASRLA